MAEIAPSILSADFARLGEEVAKVEPFADRLHIDVMDGHFVPNISMGPLVVEALRPVTHLPLEVHLMITDPATYASRFIDAGASTIIFHLEAVDDPVALLGEIRSKGVRTGLAVSPGTPFSRLEPYVTLLDLLLVMTVEPGFGGQGFMRDMLPKVAQARAAVTGYGAKADIEVDGGIDLVTAPEAMEAGADVFVAGNSIFGSGDPAAAAAALAAVLKG